MCNALGRVQRSCGRGECMAQQEAAAAGGRRRQEQLAPQHAVPYNKLACAFWVELQHACAARKLPQGGRFSILL